MLTETELAAIRAYATRTYATSSGPLTQHAEQRPAIELMPPDGLLALLGHIDALTAALAAERELADGLADSVAKLRTRRQHNGEPWIVDDREAVKRWDRWQAARRREGR